MAEESTAYVPKRDVAFCAVRADGKAAEMGDFTWTGDPDQWLDTMLDYIGEDCQPVVIYRGVIEWKPCIIRCGVCEGRGWIDDDEDTPCPACDEVGYIDVEAESTPSSPEVQQ